VITIDDLKKVDKVIDTINKQLGMDYLNRARMPHHNKWQWDVVVVDITGNSFNSPWTMAFHKFEIEHMDLMEIAKARLAAVFALLWDAVTNIDTPVEPINIQGL